MLSAIVAALLLRVEPVDQATRPGPLWEEIQPVQLSPGYHPMIRFASWDITRFNKSTTYMFKTPDFVQQGQFEVRGNRYYFRAIMANELENADIAKLISDMKPDTARLWQKKYDRSMINFEGTYDQRTKTLSITYPVDGVPLPFALHDTTEGDDQRSMVVGAADRGLTGLWQNPDPYPGRMDARSRTKYEEQGLPHFTNEAGASDSALFAVMDLRTDKSVRVHRAQGTWDRIGSNVIVFIEGKRTAYQISADGTKLLSGGTVAYVR